ncbi:rhodanese-like domain-containing protein [Geomonas limicola]|uniref:Rhodanese-like domain-containing protein n=1 Tax=Geomonas limicola TaxID=2740186 RepID=A0A6V8N9J9_9BACT|nr:rhodanese-like domain-containing protein [Geomonas limicola]GFO69266.1 rhodanese-like domain-containing protein [Geomonas limicola]
MSRSAGRVARLALVAFLCGGSIAWAGEMLSVTGPVRALANKSKTIALDQANKKALVLRFDDKTSFVNAAGTKDILPGENVSIDYQRDGDDLVATRITKMIPKLPEGVQEVPLKEMEALLERPAPDAVIIDARPVTKYASGHLPHAISIPLPTLELEGTKLLPAVKETPLIFYCGGVSCGLSHKSAQIAHSLGYLNVSVFTAGEPGWKKAEHYTIPSAAFLSDGNAVIIDLRDAKAVAAGHIPGAINVPLAQLEQWENRFPSTKSAQLVFYGTAEKDVEAAVSTARDWGYSNVTGFPGGIEEWRKAGFQLQGGSTPDRIVYRKKLGPNELGSNDFLKGLPAGTVLVDVRTPEEFKKERLPNAINIPTEQIAKRFAELPKGKPVVFYCNTGTRAEMAYDMVQGKEYAVKFLNANVEFKEDGSYKVSE